jgi:nucleotide-binding universal stress UspA family protein
MFNSILLPLDLGNTPEPDKSFRWAVDLARTNAAELHILTVLPDFGMSIVGSFFDEGFKEKALKKAGQDLTAYVETHVPAEITAKVHLAYGTVYDEHIGERLAPRSSRLR